MNRIDNSGTGIAALGRDEDQYMAHVALGEMVVPPVITPETRLRLLQEMQDAGLDPSEYTVGDRMSINPITGLPEFGFLSKAWKGIKKVIKVIAPIAAVIPGPWQSFAVVYNKANAVNNIAKGEGGLGDILTLGAGGSQKLFGDSGAIKNITSGAFKTAGGGITNAFKNIGQVAKLDNLGNVIKGETVFNPFQYSQELGKTYADNQRQGYGGFFSDVGGAGGQTFDTLTNTGNPMNAVFTPGMGGQTLQTRGQTVQTRGQQPVLDRQTWLTNNFDLSTEKIVNGKSVIQHKDGNFYTPDQALQMYEQETQTTPSTSNGFKTPQFIKSIGDAIGLGGASGLRDIYGGDGETPGFIKGIEDTIKGQTDPKSNSLFAGGGMGGLSSLALPAFLGKIAYDASKKRAGGISETPKVSMDQLGRYQLASDLGTGGTRGEFGLAPAPAVLNVAGGGPIDNRMYYAEGGLAAIQELDMRDGGESEGPGTGTSDDIPAMLSDGEFVMTAAATKGAGSFNVNKTKSGIELVSGGKPSRDKGVENMRELMNIFEAV